MEFINNKLKYTIVIGNGFDLDLKYKTRYSDFVESVEWEEMYKKRLIQLKRHSLLQYLNGKRYTDEWFDIESALLEYVSRRKDGSFVSNFKHDKEDYLNVCKALNVYLTNQIHTNPRSFNNTCAGKFLREISFNWNRENKKMYSFNFTPIEFYVEHLPSFHSPEVNYVHGQIKDTSLIIGIEVDDIHEIAPGYSFLIKSNNRNYKSSELSSDLKKSQEVIFFGHSLNNIDKGYFEEYFKMMETNEDKDKRITILTYDDDSKQQLLDNLRKNNISVQKLFTHSLIKVIRTKHVKENQNNEDSIVFSELLKRL